MDFACWCSDKYLPSFLRAEALPWFKKKCIGPVRHYQRAFHQGMVYINAQGGGQESDNTIDQFANRKIKDHMSIDPKTLPWSKLASDLRPS